MSPDRRRAYGVARNYHEAVAAAESHIDDFLYREYRRAVWHGVTPEKLLALYKSTGEAILVVPKIHVNTQGPRFDHLQYAGAKCREICAKAQEVTA